MDINEAFENIEKLNSNKKNPITGYFNLKRLSAASLFLHNHFNKQNKELPGDPKFNRDGSNSSLGRNSLRMKINNINNSDQMKLIRSLSQISNRANYDYDAKGKEGKASSASKRGSRIDFSRVDLRHRAPSLFNEELQPNDFDK